MPATVTNADVELELDGVTFNLTHDRVVMLDSITNEWRRATSLEDIDRLAAWSGDEVLIIAQHGGSDLPLAGPDVVAMVHAALGRDGVTIVSGTAAGTTSGALTAAMQAGADGGELTDAVTALLDRRPSKGLRRLLSTVAGFDDQHLLACAVALEVADLDPHTRSTLHRQLAHTMVPARFSERINDNRHAYALTYHALRAHGDPVSEVSKRARRAEELAGASDHGPAPMMAALVAAGRLDVVDPCAGALRQARGLLGCPDTGQITLAPDRGTEVDVLGEAEAVGVLLAVLLGRMPQKDALHYLNESLSREGFLAGLSALVCFAVHQHGPAELAAWAGGELDAARARFNEARYDQHAASASGVIDGTRATHTLEELALAAVTDPKLTSVFGEARRALAIVGGLLDARQPVLEIGDHHYAVGWYALGALAAVQLRSATVGPLAEDASRVPALRDAVAAGRARDGVNFLSLVPPTDGIYPPRPQMSERLHPNLLRMEGWVDASEPAAIDCPEAVTSSPASGDVPLELDEASNPSTDGSTVGRASGWVRVGGQLRPAQYSYGNGQKDVSAQPGTDADLLGLRLRLLTTEAELDANASQARFGNCTAGYTWHLRTGAGTIAEISTAGGQPLFNVELSVNTAGQVIVGEINGRYNQPDLVPGTVVAAILRRRDEANACA
jgi:hypothetical protein